MDDTPHSLGNISVAGGFTMNNSITEFVGCVEEYPIVHKYPYIECRDSETGGYGDGFGTASTTGDWSLRSRYLAIQLSRTVWTCCIPACRA